MDVFLEGKKVRLDDSALVGEGGEARVFKHQGLALKLFHPVASGDRAAAAAFDQKLARLARFPKGLPPNVVGPVALVKDKRDQVVGYAMPLVDGALDFGKLANRAWRTQLIPNEQVGALFTKLHGTLRALHGLKIVVGDLNDGNVLFRERDCFLIDTDSLQLGGLPCPVGHERFLDPRLYGVDLLAAPRFDEGTDWYAFAVLYFSSLLYVHPFGGTHPKLGTLLRRAEARHSIFQADVTVPRQSITRAVLPDDAAHWFEQVFEKDLRTPPPDALLTLPWTRCTCGLEHARAACPACHTLGPLLTRPVLKARGRCTARVAFQTAGRVLHATLQGGLRYVHEEEGVVRREDGTEVLRGRRLAGLAFAVSGPSTWVADPSGLVERFEHGRCVERARTGVRGATPILAAASSVAYRQEGEWLVEHFSGARVGQVLEGQTWLWTGERLGLGFYRAGGFTFAFLLQTGKAGLKRLEGVSWQGRVLDADARFDARHALLSVTTEANGKDEVHRWLFDEAGALLAQSHGGSAGHTALLNGRVVLGTDGGLVLLNSDGGHLVEGVAFPDTQPFVGATDELLPQPDGSLCIVAPHELTTLSLTPGGSS